MELAGISSRTADLRPARLSSRGQMYLTGHVLLDDGAWVVVRGTDGGTFIMPKKDARLAYIESK